MTVKEAVDLLHYGTAFEIRGAYSGKIYHNSRRNKIKNLEKYYDLHVTDEPFYSKMFCDKDREYCIPMIGIWMSDYYLCEGSKNDTN